MQYVARSTTLGRLADLSEDQWGLFTRRQAEATGMAWSTLARLTAHGAVVERVAHGVYRIRGAPAVDHIELRAAWLQLAPAVPAYRRGAAGGVVSHRSAAALHALGHLPADVHEFVLPHRRQSRRGDVRLHRGTLRASEWAYVRGLPATRPARIASDLLAAHEDPEAVGQVVADALRGGLEQPAAIARAIAPAAGRLGFARGDGVAVLGWLLDLTGAPERAGWVAAARGGEAS
jgi:predicted transcriptional regulator of viral defense system